MTMSNALAPPTSRITAGPWMHRGQLKLSLVLDDGSHISVTLPDDLWALQARVAALEAGGANSLEDLKYAG